MAGQMVIDLSKSLRSSYDADDSWFTDRKRRGASLGSWQDWRAWNAANPGKPKDARGRWTDSNMDAIAQRGGLFKVDEGIFIHPERAGYRNEYGHFITDLERDDEFEARMRQMEIDDAAEAADQLDADLDRGTRGAFSRFYTRPVHSMGYDEDPGRFGRGRLQVSGKGAMIIDLAKMVGGLTADLTKRRSKSGGGVGETVASWNAANPDHPKDARGRWTDTFGGGQSAVEGLLAALVREHKAEKTKLGSALMSMLGVDATASARGPRGRNAGFDTTMAEASARPSVPAEGHTVPLGNPAKPLTARGRGKGLTPEIEAEIAEMVDRPMRKDRERLKEILTGLTIAQMKDVAASHSREFLPQGNKPQKVNQMVENLIGFQLNSEAIRLGSWNERREGGARMNEINRQLGETTDRAEYKRLHAERVAISSGMLVDPDKAPSKPSKPPAMGPAEIASKLRQMDSASEARAWLNDTATVEQLKEIAPHVGVKLESGWTKSQMIQEITFATITGPRTFDRALGNPAKPLTIKPKSPETASQGGGLAQQLKDLPIEDGSEDKARAMIAGLKVAELKALAKELGPSVSQKSGKKSELIDNIVMGTVGFRLRAKAMNPAGVFGQKSDASQVEGLSGMTEHRGGSFLDKPKARSGDLTAAGRIAAAQLAEDNPIGPAATDRRMATMRAREGSAMEIGNSPELQSAVEAQWADWAARHGARRDPGKPERVLGGIKEPASQSDTYVMAHMITNKANLGMRQTTPYFLAVPRDRRGGVHSMIIDGSPDRIPSDIKRYFETTVSGDIYENDRDTGQRRWIGRIKPEEVLPKLEEGPQPEHRRRAEDAGMTEWHNFTKREWWDRESGTWVDEGGAAPAAVAATPKPKLARGSTGMTSKMETVLREIDDSGGLEMKKADFQTEYGLTDLEMRGLINEGLIETDDRAGPGYIGLTDAGNAAVRALRGGAGPKA